MSHGQAEDTFDRGAGERGARLGAALGSPAPNASKARQKAPQMNQILFLAIVCIGFIAIPMAIRAVVEISNEAES